MLANNAEICQKHEARRRIRNLMLYPAELRALGIFPRETANLSQGSVQDVRNITEPRGTFGHSSFHIPRHNLGAARLQPNDPDQTKLEASHG